jgi:hypothetical protein
MTCLVFAMGRLMEVYICNRRPLMSASDLETVSYATQQVSNTLAEAPHRQLIEMNVRGSLLIAVMIHVD